MDKCITCGEDKKNRLAAPHICKKCRKRFEEEFEKAEKARGTS